ncbi:MAG: PAS domain S-box protein [Thermodesulfobacteriota bacterium]|nr:PAS domain S-box protein [Thermodesulfobacteriota bacterium]
MSREGKSKEELLKEMDELERRLEDAEEALKAIRNGEVDAIYVEGPEGDQLFTLKGADQTYRTLIEDMNEGAVTTTADGTILYANKAFSEMIQRAPEGIVGTSIERYIAPAGKDTFEAIFQQGFEQRGEGEIALNSAEGRDVPVYVSTNTVSLQGEKVLCIAVTDLREQKRQAAILQSERLSRAILQTAGEAILVCDNDGRIIRANSAAQEFAEAPLLLKPFDDVFHLQMAPKDHHKPASPFSVVQVLQGDPLYGEEIMLRQENKDERFFLLSATHLQSEESTVGCVLVLTDKTRSKQLEMALEAERRRLAVTLSSIGDAVIAADLKARIVLMNRVAESLTGWSEEEAIGHSLHEVFHAVNEKTREPCEDPVQNVLETGKTIGLARDTLLVSRDGTERSIADSGAPIFDKDGNTFGVVLVFRDVTESKRAEEALMESERLLNEVGSIAQIGGWETDLERGGKATWTKGTYDIVEIEPTYSIPGSDDHVEWYLPEYREMIRKKMEDLIETKVPMQFEAMLKTKKGNLKWCQALGEAVERGGKVVKLRGTFQDITERKRLEDQLRQAQKMESIGTLAGGIAHDFNNILAAVMGYTEMALGDAPRGSTLKANLEEVFRGGKRAADLVRQILAFSRLSDHERKPLQVAPLVKEALKLLRSSLPASIELRSHIESDLHHVLADPTQIHQITMNLCTNAAHAMRQDGGILHVDLTQVELDADAVGQFTDITPGTYLKLTVSDTGHGMSPQTLERAFEPYFTTKEKGRGTGMGLSVVHGIVKAYGGTIKADSEPGKGATFDVYLPAKRGEAREREEAVASLPTGKERILFVDDEPTLVDLGKLRLERLGYKVTSRTSSAEALEVFKAKPEAFDLVITDMTMPEMSGDRLAQEIMTLRHDMPVILCTGYSDQISRELAEEMGIKAFVMKPTAMQDLAETARRILDDQMVKEPPSPGPVLVTDDNVSSQSIGQTREHGGGKATKPGTVRKA